MKWYIVQVTTNYERKLRAILEKKKLDGLAGKIGEVFIPFENGKLLMSGYVFIQSDAWPDFYLNTLHLSRVKCSTLGVIAQEEIEKIKPKTEVEYKHKTFRKGDQVMIKSGPFANIKGVVTRPGSKRSKISYFNGEVKIDAENEFISSYS